jgi:hypothetical protein
MHPSGVWSSKPVRAIAICVSVCLALAAGADLGHLFADDPRREGWESEAVVADLSVQLGHLAKLITSDEAIPPTEATNRSVSSRFTYILPEESARRTIFRDSQFLVVRSGPLGPEQNGWLGFLDAIRQSIHATTNRRFEFKIVGIELLDANRIATEVHSSLSGRATDEYIEQTGTWHIAWSRPVAASPIVLDSIRVDRQERVVMTTDSGEPLLTDLTGSVFRDVTSFQQQLAWGQAYWQRRIEGFHGIINPAQNGLAIGDVNGDGLDDVYVCQPGGLPNRLFVHEPDGTVRDVSAASRSDYLDETHAALLVDLDNDRDQDLILATLPALLLLENDGSGRFTLRGSLDTVRDAYSLCAADFDLDSDLDLYTCGYFPDGADVQSLPVPVPYFDATNGGTNHLLRNDGRWRFHDATTEVGLDAGNHRFSYAAVCLDYDRDGDQDLFVANDFGPSNLYQNQVALGSRQFQDASSATGLRTGAFGMSATVADVNRDGFEDVYVANMYSSAGNRVARQPRFRPGETPERRARFIQLASGNSLYLNRGGRTFQDIGTSAGVAMGRWGWGANFVDLNNDGWDDVLATNGYISGEIPHDL